MARPSNTDARREEIVNGLLQVMAKEGYERASVVEIARAAGLTPGLVHYHFGSKREILVALVARLSSALETRRERLLAGATSPKARLSAFLDAYLALGEDADAPAVAAWVAIGAEAVRQPDVREVYREAVTSAVDRLTELVRDRLAEEDRETRGARPLAAMIVCSIEGSYGVAVAAPEALPRGFAAPTVRAVLEASIAAAPEKKR